MRRYRRWTVISAVIVLLIASLCVFIVMRTDNRYHALMLGAMAVERLAHRWEMVSLRDFAWEKGHQFFLRSLALQVQRGHLAIIRLPALPPEVDFKIFVPEMQAFARSNNLSVAFTRGDSTSLMIWVRASDKRAIQDYVERRTTVPTIGQAE